MSPPDPLRVLFISINKLRSYKPVLPIGMVTVATQARAAGHSVRCVDLMFEEDEAQLVRGELDDFRPDVVGISIRNVDSLNSLEPALYTPIAAEITEWVRELCPGTTLVLGGPGFTTVPEELMQFIGADYGILGFAERSFVLLLEHLSAGSSARDVPGIIMPDGQGFHKTEPSFALDYDSVLPPARELYDPRYFSYTFETQDEVLRVPATIQTKKGCLLECIFCSNFLIDGTGVSRNDISRVVDDIERFRDQGMTSFEIVDGVFNLPLNHALALLQELERRELGLSWSCMINPGAVNDELVDMMRATGCTEVEFGTDSGCDRVLARLKKNFRQRQVRAAHELFVRAGIGIMHCLFIGSPGDDRSSVRETFDLMSELVPPRGHKVHAYWTFGLRVCRGTELHRIAVEEGVLRGDEHMLVPRYYVAAKVGEDPALIDEIEARVLANENWYLWWGLSRIPLRERIRQARAENSRIEALVMTGLAMRAEARNA